MLKAAHPGGLIPPILHPSPLNRENTGERTDRTGALLFAGAVASFGLALVLIGAAVSFAAGAPAPANLDQSTLVFGSLAAACALAALGMMLALRERSLRTQQMRRVTRAEQIQGELAGQSGPHAQGDAHCQAHPAASKLCDHRRRAAPGRAHGAIPCHEYLPEGLCQQSARFRACHPGRRAQRRPERRRPSRHSLLPQQPNDTARRPRRRAPRMRPPRPKYLLARGRLRQPGDGPPRAKPWQRARARRSRPSRWQPHDPPQQGCPAPRQAGGRTAIASAVR